ncbi:MAG: hypothetical protein AAF098_06890 [Pseudomonadota bacterium]
MDDQGRVFGEPRNRVVQLLLLVIKFDPPVHGHDGQIVLGPALVAFLVIFRRELSQEVPGAPDHRICLTRDDVVFMALLRTRQDRGDRAAEGGFFSNEDAHIDEDF